MNGSIFQNFHKFELTFQKIWDKMANFAQNLV